MKGAAKARETGRDDGIELEYTSALQRERDQAEIAGVSRELGYEYGGLA